MAVAQVQPPDIGASHVGVGKRQSVRIQAAQIHRAQINAPQIERLPSGPALIELFDLLQMQQLIKRMVRSFLQVRCHLNLLLTRRQFITARNLAATSIMPGRSVQVRHD